MNPGLGHQFERFIRVIPSFPHKGNHRLSMDFCGSFQFSFPFEHQQVVVVSPKGLQAVGSKNGIPNMGPWYMGVGDN